MTETFTLSGVGKDEILQILSNERRRLVIVNLSDREDPIDLRTLSEYVASLENDKPIGEQTPAEYKRARIGLHQAHLDRMEESGVVTRDRHLIDRGENFHAARALQKAIDDAIQFE